MNFEQAALAQFEAHPSLKIEHPRIWMILNAQDSPRRARRIARMEAEVREKMGLLPNEAVDWPNLQDIDWLTVLRWIGAILAIIVLL